MILLILVPFIFIAAAVAFALAAIIHIVVVKKIPGKRFDAHEMSCIAFLICAIFAFIIPILIF